MYEIWIAVSGGYRFVADAIEVNVDIYDDSVVITFVWEGTSFHFDKTVTADVIISDATGKSGSSWDLIT
jgi:hypothetical protein